MGVPEEKEPLDDGGTPAPQDAAPAKPDSTPEGGRPDWLVTPDDGAFTDMVRMARSDPDGPRMPTVSSIGDARPPIPPSARAGATPPGTQHAPDAETAGESPAPSAPKPGTPSAPPPSRPPLDIGTGFKIEQGVMPQGAKWNPEEYRPATATPRASTPAPSVHVVPGFDDEDEPPKPRPRILPMRPTWADDEDEAPRPRFSLASLIGDRRVQLAALVCALIAVAFNAYRSYSDGVTSIANIRRHPQQFDGRSVKVRGSVGDVFQVGSSYAYNLHEGRDTIVVFTRASAPLRHQHVVVTASVSTGYLEGVPRAALFEVKR